MDAKDYQVISPAGQQVMEAPECCRYPRKLELEMLEAGFTIILKGKRLTKTELRKEAGRK